jgi:tetratricopeptide (TPR) repeat protein
MSDLVDFEKTCFVIMPFNKKKVGRKTVDFDAIYHEIFEPAIQQVDLPEGGRLEARRTDADKFSSSINQDMFEYITYSRIAFTDISGFNPNVLYELGIRHGAQESGTVIFRQPGIDIPFDITTIKIFEYEYGTKKKHEDSRAVISELLTNTLHRNRLDSPVRLALRAQKMLSEREPKKPLTVPDDDRQAGIVGDQSSILDAVLSEAEEAVRTQDWETAKTLYTVVLRHDPSNVVVRMRLGLILKIIVQPYAALEQFSYITQLAPNYSEAWREKGVIESLIHRLIETDPPPVWLPDGQSSFKRATDINPEDFDAWASWGGVLRRKPDYPAALQKYRHSAEVSNGHPYPLLNVLKLEVRLTGKLDVRSRTDQLRTAEELRKGQSQSNPPVDTPWCFFDLAELRLYQRDKEGFLTYLNDGVVSCTADWQIQTFYNALNETFVGSKIRLAGLEEGIKKLSVALDDMKNK